MAFIRYSQPFNGHLAEVVSADKAKAIQHALDNPSEDITEAQRAYLDNIKGVYHSRTNRGHTEPEKPSQLTHEGIAQSMYDALPVNDR